MTGCFLQHRTPNLGKLVIQQDKAFKELIKIIPTISNCLIKWVKEVDTSCLLPGIRFKQVWVSASRQINSPILILSMLALI